MSSDGPGQREVAYRLFAAEYDDADYSYSESDEERAPNYVVTPTGARVNRLFAVGVLTEVERVNDEMLKGRVVDPTGAFVLYAGQYEPDEQAALERTDPPAFVAVTGKANTFEPEDGDTVYTSIRPESINTVDAETRDRWTVQAAEQTVARVGHAAAALSTGLAGEDLRNRLDERGVDPALADGITRALAHYGTTPVYLDAVRRLALDAARVVAGQRDEAQELTLAPDDSGDVTAADLLVSTPDTDSVGTATDREPTRETTDAGVTAGAGSGQDEQTEGEPAGSRSSAGGSADPADSVPSDTTAIGDTDTTTGETDSTATGVSDTATDSAGADDETDSVDATGTELPDSTTTDRVDSTPGELPDSAVTDDAGESDSTTDRETSPTTDRETSPTTDRETSTGEDPGEFGEDEDTGGFGESDNPGGFDGSDDPGGFGEDEDPGGFGESEDPGGFDGSDDPGGFDGSDDLGEFGEGEDPGGFGESGDPGEFGEGEDTGGFGGSEDPGEFGESDDLGELGGSEDPGEFEGGDFELPDEVREEVDEAGEKFDTGFQSGTEVDDPGEAGIPTPETETDPVADPVDSSTDTVSTGDSDDTVSTGDSDDTVSTGDLDDTVSTGDPDDTVSTGDGSEETETSGSESVGVAEAGAGEAETDETAGGIDDPQEAVLAVMTDLDDGSGADREALVAETRERHGLDAEAVADAIESALMDGKCYEPDEHSLKPI
jgi:hypothetical protein